MPQQECQPVSEFGNKFAGRFAQAVAGFGFDANQGGGRPGLSGLAG
jgi:hypothetical protein